MVHVKSPYGYREGAGPAGSPLGFNGSVALFFCGVSGQEEGADKRTDSSVWHESH